MVYHRVSDPKCLAYEITFTILIIIICNDWCGVLQGKGDTSGGCKCNFWAGRPCHPDCGCCH